MNNATFGLATSFAAFAAFPALADINTIPSQIKGAPEHRIPMSASQIAEVKVREILAEKLAHTLISETEQVVAANIDPMSELDRIFAFAELPPVTTAGSAAEQGATEQAAETTSTQTAPEFAEEEGDVFASMTDDQMRFLALMAAAIQNPDDMIALASNIPGAGQAATSPSYDTANASIMLRGWDVRMDGNGTTHLFQANQPNSSIELEQGIVIGALGAVTEIRKIGEEVHVFFESGDSISGEAYTMAAGIPPLPPLSDVTAAPQEILLSYGPRTTASATETISTSGRMPEQSGFISLSAAVPTRNLP